MISRSRTKDELIHAVLCEDGDVSDALESLVRSIIADDSSATVADHGRILLRELTASVKHFREQEVEVEEIGA